ncbi:hypothetical protein BFL43_15640 [Williamsia sp. 1135]|nr:hypothetical protein BFL43_15640 [Williamsia sp. 1135]
MSRVVETVGASYRQAGVLIQLPQQRHLEATQDRSAAGLLSPLSLNEMLRTIVRTCWYLPEDARESRKFCFAIERCCEAAGLVA